MRIVDKNGNEVGVTINTDKKGNKTASYSFAEGTKESVMKDFNNNGGKVVNSMINSDKGLELVNSVIDSKDNVSIKISAKTKLDRLGDSKTTMKHTDSDTGETTKDISVTIYQGSINAVRSSVQQEAAKAKLKMWNDNNLTNDEIIGSIGGHEFHHVLNDMDKGKLSKVQHSAAYDVENDIIKQFGEKK